jgi:hypothetical protein
VGDASGWAGRRNDKGVVSPSSGERRRGSVTAGEAAVRPAGERRRQHRPERRACTSVRKEGERVKARPILKDFGCVWFDFRLWLLLPKS